MRQSRMSATTNMIRTRVMKPTIVVNAKNRTNAANCMTNLDVHFECSRTLSARKFL